ncbi:transcriptional regulator [Roseateles saccharophilus]|uniref:Uncharacterized protein n=1 Tax=Roseateles saccharophilus TaxID=304 RepID=A0A4R3UJT0_ROSSA|nr:transcriptional regulator [Roseateles saccharophilus]MDG0834874.1 transcriptional regulator [Roseateles saccharophilus]TCU88406.1 hypothetical protein EV671_103932 [Roseateles saccharophilus]
MTVRFSITLSDRLNQELEQVAGSNDDKKVDALRKAIHLYIAATKATHEGKKVGIARPNQELATEFVGL